ncbi:hypothetical protein Ocin01_12156 [Orchesella cincta]|uniref:Uncharacterized protein n=1 Tax=Orchesella cincta TaxID=48709 RepID=A0A1D2MNL0_ORCCI|nr:hypothetical protein Ocin01_12156 [Orchesella cincta]
MADQTNTASPDVILQSVIYEVTLVFTTAGWICILIAAVALGRNAFFATLYWVLKIVAIVKMCTVHEPASAVSETNTAVKLLTDCFAYFVIATASEGLLETYFRLKIVDQRFYGIYYNFTLNFFWALQAEFLIRLIYLSVVTIYDMIWPRRPLTTLRPHHHHHQN